MKLEKLVGDRFKERPADCQVDSHALMIRGGYMKNVANGIYSSYMPLKRITRKIEQIIREEMDAIDGQEVQFPVVMPASLWQESGRYDSIGKELLRFTDRNGAPMVLGMTHEEAAVQLVREYGQSYAKYPFMIYQIQTKFRDEARPRAGLIRVREFTMKDAYSFHTSQEDLEQYYDKCHKAYERIYARAGIPEVVSVKSDSGMMGGNVSHEFMLLTPIGEDSIVICNECDYRANMEAAENIVENETEAMQELLEQLRQRGVASTQATISRDIKQLHLVKEPTGHGTYKYAVSSSRARLNIADKLRTIFHESITSVDCAQNIVVFKTLAGLAGGACEALDHMDVNGMVGTLAGENTVFVVMKDNACAETFCQEIREML